MNSLRTQKKALRKSITSTIQSLPASAIADQSRAIAERVLSLPSFQNSKAVSCYLSMPSGEVDTSLLVMEILRHSKSLFVPKIASKEGRMDFLKVYGQDDLDSFPSGLWGIREPEASWQGSTRQNVLDESAEELDLILLPGVAFDKSLSRLGHGKGYYDRFITSYLTNGRRRPHLVALSLREQLLEKNTVPMGEHDWKMDLVITPDQIFGSEKDQGV